MIQLPNYQVLDLLYESPKSVVCRGYRNQDRTPVILKTLKTDYPTTTDIAKLKHEYEIIKNLDLAGIVKAYSLETYNNNPLLVLEDFGGQDLASVIATRELALHQCLKIAIQLATTLGELHQNQIIHKDVKPQNIIVNLETEQVKLSDFSISSQLSKENPTLKNPNLLEGTLAYMSPEQTGRMNRAVDYRTDFYSLGVTLYEMLAGRLPFQATDPMELVHCHIAKQPIPIHELKPEIPESVSILVMKLLAKTAEDRYQSAYGIKADLETCLNQFLNSGKVEQFIPGQQDLSGQFEIPQKLYGRELEVATFMEAFERVARGTTEMMLVAGYSGIGKSALVNEVHKPIVRQRGYFIAGKFDQYKRNIPYASLIQAFQELIRQLLTEPEAQIQNWERKLLDALGTKGQVIIDVIPEVELIIGTQPPVVQLPPSEAQNRFNLLFKKFIHVFTQKEHPLVMFLDDLQWADSASLKLIELLTTDPDGQYLLTIGAYRDNEVSPTHPLMVTLNEIKSKGITVNTITLKPLKLVHITQLIADTVNSSIEKAQPLAELILQKTAGNPFFLTQLLKYLYLESFLKFNFSTGKWEWNIEQIQRIGITDNVVELMVSKVQKLSEATQAILKLAACVGNPFNLTVLSIVNEKSQSATAAELWEALQAGLIVPLTDAYKVPKLLEKFDELIIDYKFLHDRVQQAAYSLIPENKKQEVHLKVGQLLLKNTSPAEREEKTFDIVNQFNIGAELITDPSERYELAQLNLMAGQKAKAATAYESALKYLTVGIELLADGSWQSHYHLTLALYVEAVEVQYLTTNFEKAQQLSEIVLAQANSLLDKVKVYELKIQFYIAQNQMIEAIDTALPVVDLLGYPLSQNPRELSLVAELPQLSDLESFPEMTNPAQLAVLQILTIITGPAYQAKPDLLPFIVFKMVNLCLEFGHSALAAYAYGMYGLMLCGPLGDIETGYHSGQLSLRLLEQYPDQTLKCKIHMLFNSFVGHWKEPHRETIPAFVDNIQMGFETGDVVYIAYCCMWSCGYLLLTGDPLDMVEEKQRQYVELLEKIKQEHGLYPAKTWRQLTLNLQGLATDNYQLVGESFNQADMQHIEEINNRMLLFFAYFARLILAYIFKDYETAVANTKLAAEYQAAATASMLSGGYVFYDSLARLALYPTVNRDEQQAFLQQIESNQAKMQDWAHHAAMNYQSKYELVEAEKARVLGRVVEAMERYDRAIALAREHGYIQEIAIASERAAEFYHALGRERFAQLYLVDAHYAYCRWGAMAKAQELQQAYPQLLSQRFVTVEAQLTTVPTTPTTGDYGGVLDLTTLMKASQAISSEIVLDKLLSALMKIIIQNAGAQTGYLILQSHAEPGNEERQWRIEAEGSVESDGVTVLQSIAIDNRLPASIINYVARTKETVVLNDATRQGKFTLDPYIKTHQTKSILCAPLINQGHLSGIVYLENNLTPGAFTRDRLEVLQLLSGQAAIAITNAQLYEALFKAEHKYRSIFENALEGIFQTTPDGRYLSANPALAHLYGYDSPQELIAAIADIARQVYIEPHYRTEFVTLMQQHDAVSGFEARAYRKDGSIIWINEHARTVRNSNGEILYYQGFVQDITERKQAEQLLAEYNQALEQKVEERTQELSQALSELKATQEELIQSEKMAALGQLVAGIAHEINTPLGAIRSSVSNITKFLNQTLQELPTLLQSLPPQVTQDFLALVQRSLQQKSTFSAKERRQLKRALIRQLEAFEVEKAQILADLLSDMGIYQDVEAFLPLLTRPDSEHLLEIAYKLSGIQRGTQTIETATDRAAKVVFALKTYARYDFSGEMKLANPIEGIETVLTLYHNQLKHGVEIIRHYEESPPVLCYPDELNQVWTNLIHNALQAMENKGTLTIDVTRQSQFLKVSITDSGKGIPPEIMPKIFDPFFTTKPPGEGSGLGLDIVNKIIEKHQGKITVDSQPGRTTFNIFLPIELSQETENA